MAALLAPALEHVASIGGLHSNSEAVRLLTVSVVGLVGSLHQDAPGWSEELRLYRQAGDARQPPEPLPSVLADSLILLTICNKLSQRIWPGFGGHQAPPRRTHKTPQFL